jgi:hypothetical protein
MAAAVGAVITLTLMPFVPVGIPIIVASVGALIGLRRS